MFGIESPPGKLQAIDWPYVGLGKTTLPMDALGPGAVRVVPHVPCCSNPASSWRKDFGHVCMDGWLDGCMDGRMHASVEERMDGWMGGCVNRWMGGWVAGWTGEIFNNVRC